MKLSQEEILQTRKHISKEILPKHFSHFEKFLSVSKSGWLANSSNPTMADLFFGSRLRHNFVIERDEGVDENILEEFPLIKSHFNKFSAIPAVKKYLDDPHSVECLKITDVSHLPASPLPEVADIHHMFHNK